MIAWLMESLNISFGEFGSLILDQTKGSLVKQYPPTPNPGYSIFECVGLIFIASITSYKSILTLSANRLIHQ